MKIYWTKSALNSLSDIYKYYKKNVGLVIAGKIRDGVVLSLKQIEYQPLSGPVEEFLLELDQEFRYIVHGNYKIIYRILNHKIYITDVFDTRQDPDKIKQRHQ